MSQLHFYVPDSVEKDLREQAKQANLPLSRYLAELVRQRTSQPAEWPAGYFDRVFGCWEGGPLRRAPQGEYEERSGFS